MFCFQNLTDSIELRDRLLGETKLKTTSSDSTSKIRLLDTPAEEGLKEVFSKLRRILRPGIAIRLEFAVLSIICV